MKNKKKIITILILCIVVIVIIGVIIVLSPKTKKKYDIQSIKDNMITYYDGLRFMDFVDLTELFGIDLSDTENSVFMSNIELEKHITQDTIMIIVINAEQTEEYYNIFRSFLDSNMLNTEDIDMLEYYGKAKLVQGDGYVYLLMGDNTEDLLKEINVFYR